MTNTTYLIVDDNSIDRMIVSTLLKKCLDNPKVHIAEDSNSGINWITNNKKSCPGKLVILLDMQMPDIDGFGFLDTYTQLSSELRIGNEIIMLSSMDSKSLQIKKAQNHSSIKAILAKPLNIDELKEVI